jgi:hypothetical protein
MARYSDLKQENAELRLLLASFIQKHHVTPGDLLVFKPSYDKQGRRTSSIGESFGLGYGGMHNIRLHLERAAGGPVMVMASNDDINVKNLDREERHKLRELLDQVDGLAKRYPPPGPPNPPPPPPGRKVG